MTLGSELLICEHSNLLGHLQLILLGIFYLVCALSVVINGIKVLSDRRQKKFENISENIPIRYNDVNGCTTELVRFSRLHIYQLN